MSVFDKLFGKKGETAHSTLKNSNKVSLKTVNSSAANPQKDQTRTTYCDVCGKYKLAMLTNEGFYNVPTRITEINDDMINTAPFVGSCPICDIDVCNHCSKWMKDLEYNSITIKTGVSIYGPVCPRCGEKLAPKADVDIKCFNSFQDWITNDKMALSQKLKAGFRLYRIFNDACNGYNCHNLDLNIVKQTLPMLEQFRIELANEYLTKGWNFLQQAKSTDAIECFNEALKILPETAIPWYAKGCAFLDNDKIKAIECFDKVLTIDPKHAATWKSKGFALKDMGRIKEAKECFATAIQLNPEYKDQCGI